MKRHLTGHQQGRVDSRIGRVALALAVVATGIVLITTPYSSAPAGASLNSGCKDSGYSCVEGGYNASTMNNNWATRYYGAAAAGGIGNPPHNCTLYAAWMLARNGMGDPRRTWGNATDWGNTLASITNPTPAIGSIAWYAGGRAGIGTFGHVAYVANINWTNNTVFLESDNYIGGSGGYTSNGWVPIGEPSGYIHAHDVGGGGGGVGGPTFVASTPLSITAPSGWFTHAPITMSFTVTNVSNGGAGVKDLFFAIRDPWGSNYDHACLQNATIDKGQSESCSFTLPWGSTGTYTVWPDFEGDDGNYHAIAPQQTFNLAPAGTFVASTPLSITAPSGWFANAPIRETFTVTNVSGNSASIQKLVLAVRDPSNRAFDQVCGSGLTLAAGQAKSCDLVQTWGSPGTYTVWVDWLDNSNPPQWHQGQLGQNASFVLASDRAPTSPLNVRAKSGAKSAVVTWDAPTDLGGASAVTYVVSSSSTSQTCTSATLQCKVTGLVTGRRYSFEVTAITKYGKSPLSAGSSPIAIR